MNEGLVLLAAWAQWLLLVIALLLAVLRRVQRVHDRGDEVLYERPEAGQQP